MSIEKAINVFNRYADYKFKFDMNATIDLRWPQSEIALTEKEFLDSKNQHQGDAMYILAISPEFQADGGTIHFDPDKITNPMVISYKSKTDLAALQLWLGIFSSEVGAILFHGLTETGYQNAYESIAVVLNNNEENARIFQLYANVVFLKQEPLISVLDMVRVFKEIDDRGELMFHQRIRYQCMAIHRYHMQLVVEHKRLEKKMAKEMTFEERLAKADIPTSYQTTAWANIQEAKCLLSVSGTSVQLDIESAEEAIERLKAVNSIDAAYRAVYLDSIDVLKAVNALNESKP